MKHKSINKDVFVTDISFEATEEDLQKLFALCGTVRAIHMMTDPKTGKFRGCAFVRMSTAEEAKDAVVTLDELRLLDRCISVQPARPKATTPPAVTEAPPEKPKRTRRPGRRRK